MIRAIVTTYIIVTAAESFASEAKTIESKGPGFIREICHDGVLYVYYKSGNGGGMAVKRNRDGTVASCES